MLLSVACDHQTFQVCYYTSLHIILYYYIDHYYVLLNSLFKNVNISLMIHYYPLSH